MRNYTSTSEEIAGVRGPQSVGSSPLLMTRRPRLVCDFDDLDVNVLPNQILERRWPGSKSRQSGSCTSSRASHREKQFRRIDRIPLTRSAFRRVQVTRNNPHYGFLMKVCELAFLTTLPNEKDGSYRFADILATKLGCHAFSKRSFETFLRLERHYTFKVGATQIPWDALPENEYAAASCYLECTQTLSSPPQSGRSSSTPNTTGPPFPNTRETEAPF